MANEKLGVIEITDVVNVLRCGQLPDEGELEKGTYRYRVHTKKSAWWLLLMSQNK
jgi:hypothetical protein